MFKHKKKLGQNFLTNKKIIKKITDIANINKNTNIIEIGPGSGNLTEELIKKNPKEIYAIEFDKDLTNYLEKIKNNCENFNYTIKIMIKDKISFELILENSKDNELFNELNRIINKCVSEYTLESDNKINQKIGRAHV